MMMTTTTTILWPNGEWSGGVVEGRSPGRDSARDGLAHVERREHDEDDRYPSSSLKDTGGYRKWQWDEGGGRGKRWCTMMVR
ncbi:scavenger receptor cysteine-rich type 1 protein M130-like protein [Anopheles sinensis]|uniref:Scavenger receptor cysteine-rich type 1 protein M130-like protein n=1 Tax=Anopheles sinensis TaxID=74873 RepID=A0A084W826_ANOSI|nr:scavenger receptor cysteine-rich type 1 protein M130-like protein [Anopheles sinensis]